MVSAFRSRLDILTDNWNTKSRVLSAMKIEWNRMDLQGSFVNRIPLPQNQVSQVQSEGGNVCPAPCALSGLDSGHVLYLYLYLDSPRIPIPFYSHSLPWVDRSDNWVLSPSVVPCLHGPMHSLSECEAPLTWTHRCASNPLLKRCVWSSLVSHQVKDLVLSLQWLRLLPWVGFDPWPGNFHTP